MTYPVGFRNKVLSYKKKHNLSIRKTARHFEISINSVVSWTKNLEPAKTKTKSVLKIAKDALRKDIEDYPDDFLYERAKRFDVTAAGICLALKRINLSRKKNIKAPKT